MLLNGYALLSDIAKQTKISYGALHMRKTLIKSKVGERVAIEISSLKKEEQLDTLHDLGAYVTPKQLSFYLGMSSSYISVWERVKEIKYDDYHVNQMVRLIKLPDEIIDAINSGKTIYKLLDNEEFENPLDFYGIKLGYY
jgi:hypothetical protein